MVDTGSIPVGGTKCYYKYMVGSVHFRQILFIRFLAYVCIFTGSLTALGILEPIVGEEMKYRTDQLFQVKHRLPQTIITSAGQSQQPTSSTSFGGLSFGSNQQITPLSTDFGIVIEKINANAAVIPNINPNDYDQYEQALAKGVAQVAGSTEPGQPGNLYIFSHSADAPWNIVRFNAIFYLLREMEPGDKVVVFYKGRRYDYIVYDKHITNPEDTSYLTNRYDQPVLTLQTCDPPGTLANRLIVRAKLEGF